MHLVVFENISYSAGFPSRMIGGAAAKRETCGCEQSYDIGNY